MRAQALVCLAALHLLGGRAGAQSAAPPALRAHHMMVSGGVVWAGGYGIGDATATLRTNALGATAPPFTLFDTSTRVNAVAGVHGHVGAAVSSSLSIEAGVAYSAPTIGVAVSADPEASPVEFEGERLEQFVIDVAARWHLPLRLGARTRPFVSGGAGYLRQLHEDRTLVETGQVYFAGGGVSYWLHGASGRSRAIGLRGEARATWRRHGIDFENQIRTFPTLAASLFVGF